VIRLSGEGSLGRQVYLGLREAIVSGRLSAGARLPSTRALAEELGVSRTVTQLAFEQLTAEGYLRARVGSGTYVAADLSAARTATADLRDSRFAPRLSSAGERVLGRTASLYSSAIASAPRYRYNFRPGLPPLGDFPHDRWRRMLSRHAGRTDLASHDYGPPEGNETLREAIASYLGRSRALACSPEQVLVVHGSQQGVDLCARLLVDPGEAAAVEEPGYEGARNAFAFLGARVVPVPVDADGLDIAALSRTQARIVHVTPSHQFPTGAVLGMPRRLALLAWADRADATIIEDDYDGEFRFDARPLTPLQALDRRGRVLYLGTFSKVMFPGLRLGYLVLPPSLLRVFRRAKPLLDGGSSALVQAALAEFLSSGAFELYVRRLRRRMAGRREALLEELERRLGAAAEVLGASAGLHVLLRFHDLGTKRLEEVIRRAAGYGVGLYSAAPYYAGSAKRAELVLGYAGLTPAAIGEGIRRVARALQDTGG
jgi:GntR family transcriptional regulator/MocR family aminotransferase